MRSVFLRKFNKANSYQMRRNLSVSNRMVYFFTGITLLLAMCNIANAFNQVSVESYTRFADNLEAGRVVIGQQIEMSGQIASPASFNSVTLGSPADNPCGFSDACKCLYNTADPSEGSFCTKRSSWAESFCVCYSDPSPVVIKDPGPLMFLSDYCRPDYVAPGFEHLEYSACDVQDTGETTDPQTVFLMNSFVVDGVNVIDELVGQALLTDNILFQRNLPAFFGGATFTAIRAFGGRTLTNTGKPVLGTEVGFGVLELNSGESFFCLIIFLTTLNNGSLIDSIELDLSPVVSDSQTGAFTGEALVVHAVELLGVTNNSVDFSPIIHTYKTTLDPTGCPDGYVGTFSFKARLRNITTETPLTTLEIQIATLTGENLVQNSEGDPVGVEATLKVPRKDDFLKGVLFPAEFVNVNFVVCLKELRGFSFYVNILGLAFPGTHPPPL